MTATYDGCGYLIRPDLLPQPDFPATGTGNTAVATRFVAFGRDVPGGGGAGGEARWASEREVQVCQ